MKSETSEADFYLIDRSGNRRVPQQICATHGSSGYAIHPSGKGNDAQAARYVDDLKDLVQSVVLHGQGVRAVAKTGSQEGQRNTVYLGKRAIRGYWLAPDKHAWVHGATIGPENGVRS